MTSFCRLLRRLQNSRSGVAAVETALVFPLLAAMLLAVVEFSFVFYTYNSMQSAARDAARQAALQKIAAGEVSAEVKQHLPQWAVSYATASMLETAPSDPESNMITISVSLPSSHASPVALFTSYGGWTLLTQVTMKEEAL